MRIRNLLEICLLGTLFGPSFFFIKLGVAELSPFTLVAARVALATAFLWALLKIRGQRFPRSLKTWWHISVAGFFSAGLPFSLFAVGELRVSSALAGVINGFTPIATALMAHFMFSDERLTLSRTTGVLLGMGGFSLLLFPQIAASGLQGDATGILLLGIAAISYAIAMVYSRKTIRDLPPLVAPTGGLFVACFYLIPLAFFTNSVFETAPLTYKGLVAIAELGIVGTALAFILYYRILRTSGATTLAMSNYLLPLFSTLLGVLILRESMHWTAYLAGVLIILGMMFVNGTLKIPSAQKETAHDQEAAPAPVPIDSDPDRPTD